MLELGTGAPDFSLPDIDGRPVSRKNFLGKPLLVMFICNHCPFVLHVRDKLAEIGRIYQDKGVAVVAINSNDTVSHPDDSPENMVKEARLANYSFPYLFDESQSVAMSYEAACTPDFFLFDREHKLVYRGQLDDSRPGNGRPVTGKDLQLAMDALLAGRAPSSDQLPSMGCNIKWKKGNEPGYFAR
jgi:peroxiredoxin